MTKNVQEIVRSILGIEDPVSIPTEERRKQTRSQDFFNAKEEDLVQAYLAIPAREKQPHFDSLFDFLMTIRRYADAYEKSGELWKAFGDCETPQLVNIQLDAERRTGKLLIARFTRDRLLELTKDPRQKQWAEFYIPRLDSLQGKIMILLFTDDEKSQLFGFPFDVMLTSVPNSKVGA